MRDHPPVRFLLGARNPFYADRDVGVHHFYSVMGRNAFDWLTACSRRPDVVLFHVWLYGD